MASSHRDASTPSLIGKRLKCSLKPFLWVVLQVICTWTLHRDQEGMYMIKVNQSSSSLELEGTVLFLFLMHLSGSIPSAAATRVLAWLHGRSWANSPARRIKGTHFFFSWNKYFPSGGVNCTEGVNGQFPQSELISEDSDLFPRRPKIKVLQCTPCKSCLVL